MESLRQVLYLMDTNTIASITLKSSQAGEVTTSMVSRASGAGLKSGLLSFEESVERTFTFISKSVSGDLTIGEKTRRNSMLRS